MPLTAWLGQGTLYRMKADMLSPEKRVLGADLRCVLLTFIGDGTLYRLANGTEIFVLIADEVEPAWPPLGGCGCGCKWGDPP